MLKQLQLKPSGLHATSGPGALESAVIQRTYNLPKHVFANVRANGMFRQGTSGFYARHLLSSKPIMHLANSHESYLKLTIAGYQYPSAKPGTHYDTDANWLFIRVDASLSGRAWSAIDPCMLTWEVEYLAAWLDKVQHNEPLPRLRCDFTEPLLVFELVNTDSQNQRLRVYFEGEVRPPWQPAFGVGLEDLWLELPLAELDLTAAVHSLRSQLETFPVRR